RDTGNVQSSTRDKTRASCLDLIRIRRDEVVVHSEWLPSNTKIAEKIDDRDYNDLIFSKVPGSGVLSERSE
ncbi:MAG: hypothetical protein ACOYNR_16665, partial [Blastocatellia bacterium]